MTTADDRTRADQEAQALERTYEEALLAAATIETALVINKLLHDQADLMENLATARVLAGIKQRMLEWGMQNDTAVHEEREMRLHRMINRLRSESAEGERRYAAYQQAQENGEQTP